MPIRNHASPISQSTRCDERAAGTVIGGNLGVARFCRGDDLVTDGGVLCRPVADACRLDSRFPRRSPRSYLVRPGFAARRRCFTTGLTSRTAAGCCLTQAS